MVLNVNKPKAHQATVQGSSTSSFQQALPCSILLSIKPAYADLIFSGKKRFEYRRSLPVKPISRFFVYESSPVSRLVGWVNVSGIVKDNPILLYERTAWGAGLSQESFLRYFKGKNTGSALILEKTHQFVQPMGLSVIRLLRPPQNFCYMKESQLKQIIDFQH